MHPGITQDCSAMSQDLNHIESLRRGLETEVKGRRQPNMGELEQFAQEEWAKITVQWCRELDDHFRKYLIAVILTKGCSTKY